VHAADVPDPTRIVDGYPPELSRIVRRALARDRDLRYPTAGVLAAELDAFAAGAVSTGTVADVMRELFAQDRARQAAWVADASAPGGSRPLEPLKAPSTFWIDQDAAQSASVSGGPGPAASSARTPWYRRRLFLACCAVAVAAFVAVVLAVR
jgi:hypothetical protein